MTADDTYMRFCHMYDEKCEYIIFEFPNFEYVFISSVNMTTCDGIRYMNETTLCICIRWRFFAQTGVECVLRIPMMIWINGFVCIQINANQCGVECMCGYKISNCIIKCETTFFLLFSIIKFAIDKINIYNYFYWFISLLKYRNWAVIGF